MAQTNFFRKHVQKKKAVIAAKQADEDNSLIEDAPESQLVLAQLGEHQRALSNIQSKESKIAFKAEHIAEYAGYVEGILEENLGGNDPIIPTIMIWAFDTGHFDYGLDLAEYALEHELTMPDRYKRTLPCVIAEEVATAGIKEVGTVNADQILKTQVLIDGSDMPDEVKAKLYKASGLLNQHAENWQAANDDFEQAVKLHDKSGVKELLKKLKPKLVPQEHAETIVIADADNKNQDNSNEEKDKTTEGNEEDEETRPG